MALQKRKSYLSMQIQEIDVKSHESPSHVIFISYISVDDPLRNDSEKNWNSSSVSSWDHCKPPASAGVVKPPTNSVTSAALSLLCLSVYLCAYPSGLFKVVVYWQERPALMQTDVFSFPLFHLCFFVFLQIWLFISLFFCFFHCMASQQQQQQHNTALCSSLCHIDT